MLRQNKSVSSWLKTEFAGHQWCSSVLSIYPSPISPGIQIFVLLSLSSVHRWSRFLTLLSEAKKVRRWSDTLAFRLRIDSHLPILINAKQQNVCFFSPSQLLFVVDQHSGDWWVRVHAHLLLKQTVFVTFSPWPTSCLLTSSQEFTPLASFQWRLSYLSIARSVLRCHRNISDCVNQRINDRLTPLCVPPSCLDQLKSVGHLPKAVLMYRVSVK